MGRIKNQNYKNSLIFKGKAQKPKDARNNEETFSVCYMQANPGILFKEENLKLKEVKSISKIYVILYKEVARKNTKEVLKSK